MKVLFISQWYPHRYDAMEGLFVRKHAEAVSLYTDVKVLFVYADENIKKMEFVKQTYNSVSEYYVYYPISPKNPFHKIIKSAAYLLAYKRGFAWLRQEGFSPDIVHANILTRTATIAYLYKLLTKTPYVITEHWSRYLSIRNQFHGFLRTRLAKIVVRNAKCIIPVSEELKKGLKYHRLLLTECKVVENVVDNYFYELREQEKHSKKQLLNVNCFDEKSKNIKGLLRVIKRISKTRDDFEFLIVGTGKDFDDVFNYFQSLNIKQRIVKFTGEITEKEVANLMYQVDTVVQFSNYETAGVVVQEALVTGCPVISTKVGIAPKYISENSGILVNIGNEKELYTAVNYILDNHSKFDRDMIRKIGDSFSYQTIGKRFVDIYKEEEKA